MGAQEACSVCHRPFEVQFRYQVEEQPTGRSYFCSQSCLDRSLSPQAKDAIHCDCCAKAFTVELVSQVVYLRGQRKYACSAGCRAQLTQGLHSPSLSTLASTPVANADASDGTQDSPPRVLPSVRPAPSSGRFLVGTLPSSTGTPTPPAVTPSPSGTTRTSVDGAASASRVTPMIPGVDLPRRIAVFNHKGGTGKTTTAVSVAAGLALRGKRVLLVDTDSQGNVSMSLSLSSEKNLYHVVVMGLSAREAWTEVRPGLFVIPANETLAAAELFLAGRQQRDRYLAQRLAPVLDEFDHVVVDCSPSLSLLNQNALCLVDSVLVPVACDYLSLVGMRQVIKTIKGVNQHLHHPVRIWGVLPTFYDSRANICREAVDTLKQHFGPRCLRPIRQAIRVKEAPAQGQTIFEYATGSSPAEDYSFVVEAILGNISYEQATESHRAPMAATG